MKTIKLEIGNCVCFDGKTQEHMRPVEFVGEEMARNAYLTGTNDTRGVTEILYKAEDGRLLVSMWRIGAIGRAN